MNNKYYTVVISGKMDGDCKFLNFNDKGKADACAKENKGKLFEFEDYPFGEEPPELRDKLMAPNLEKPRPLLSTLIRPIGHLLPPA